MEDVGSAFVQLPCESDYSVLYALINEKKLINNICIDIDHGSKKGDNYIGLIYRITVKGTTNNGTTKTFNLIMKCSQRSPELRVQVPIQKFYEREKFVYEHVLPNFEQLQKSKGIIRRFASYPEYYKSCIDNFKECIVAKDMTIDGYVAKDRKKPFDFEHTVLVLKELARFHALSFVLKDQQPEVFASISERCPEILINSLDSDEFRNQIDGLFKRAARAFNETTEAVYLNKLEQFSTNIYETLIDLSDVKSYDQYSVMIHGDPWICNFLFKYEDSHGESQTDTSKPSSVCFLDFQESRCMSPICDISNFVYLCVDTMVLETRFDELLDAYYNELADFVTTLGSDVNRTYPKRAFEDHVAKYFKCGVIFSCIFIHILYGDSEDIPDFEEKARQGEKLTESIMFDSKRQSEFDTRIRNIVKHAVDKHFI